MDSSDRSDDGFKALGSYFADMMAEREAICPIHGAYVEKILKVGGVERASGCECCLRERQSMETRDMLTAQNQQARQERVAAILKRTGVPKRYKDEDFDTFTFSPDASIRKTQKTVVSALREYAENFESALEVGANLLFAGNSGTGKSHLACAIAKRVAENGYTSLFIETRAIVNRVMSARGSNVSSDDVIDELASLDLLIIDELESFYGEGAREILIEVVNERYKAQRPIIAITNLEVGELNAKVAARTVDRLRHHGKIVPFTWDSYRRKVTHI